VLDESNPAIAAAKAAMAAAAKAKETAAKAGRSPANTTNTSSSSSDAAAPRLTQRCKALLYQVTAHLPLNYMLLQALSVYSVHTA
jgi:hypothetical protein